MERIVLRPFHRMLPTLIALVMVLTATGPLGASENPETTAAQTANVQPTSEDTAAEEALDADETLEEDAFMQDLLNESTGSDIPDAAGADTGTALPLSYEGEVMGSLWAPNDHDDEWHTSNRLDLMGWKEFGSLSVDGRLRLDYQDLAGEDKARVDLRELYATYPPRPRAGGYVDLAMGKKSSTGARATKSGPWTTSAPKT